MPTFLELFLPPLGLSFLISLASTFLVIKVVWKIGLVDDPKRHKHPKVIHTYPVPRGGGLPIFFALVLGILLFLKVDLKIAGVLVGAVACLVVGLADDKLDLSPYLRIVTNLLTAVPLVAVGISLSFVTNPFGGIINFTWWQTIILTLLWVGGLMNFVGMGAGGVEGQQPGVIAIAAITLGLLSARYISDPTQWPAIVLAAVTAGAYLGFLPWNFYPQKIMPGYSGKSLAGYLLAVLSLLAVAKLQTLLMVLAVPLADTGWVMLRRMASGKSPVWGDNTHFHHLLLGLGWGKRRVAIFYWVITAFSGALALLLNSRQKFYTLVAAFLIIGGVALWISFWTSSRRSAQNSG